MSKREKRRLTSVLFLFFLTLQFLFLKTNVYAFTMEITNVDPPTVENVDQIVTVSVSLNDLPSGDSYFRAGWKSGNTYIGYVQNNSGEWIKLRALSEGCIDYYKVSETANSLQLKIKLDDFAVENGSYSLKAHRFTSTCSSNSGSNEYLTYINLPIPTNTPTPIPSNSPTPISSRTPSVTTKPSQTLSPTPKPTLTPVAVITITPTNAQSITQNNEKKTFSSSTLTPSITGLLSDPEYYNSDSGSVAAKITEYIPTGKLQEKVLTAKAENKNYLSPKLLFLIGGILIITGALISLARNYKVRE